MLPLHYFFTTRKQDSYNAEPSTKKKELHLLASAKKNTLIASHFDYPRRKFLGFIIIRIIIRNENDILYILYFITA